MLIHTFEQLSIKKQYRVKPKDQQVVPIGYDTETQGGLCKLLCSPSYHLHPMSFDDILFFLTSHKNRGKIGFFYNLRYDFQAILKWLDPTYWETILERGLIEYDCKPGLFRVIYIPGKMLSIRRKTGKKSRRFDFYDISPFFGKGPLDKVALKYLGRGKKDVSKFDMPNLKNADFLDPEMIEYCKEDAKLTEELAEYWIKLCNEQGVFPSTFVSTASIAVRYYQSRCKIPTINSFIKPSRLKYLKIPWLACSGPFITVYKRGRFSTCYEYDLNSAYPKTMTELPDISRGRFMVSKGAIPDNAYLGWVQVTANLWNNSEGFYFPPLPMPRKGLSNFFPYGSFSTFITLKEFRAYEKDLKLDLIAGLYWIPTHSIRYPYKNAIEEIYAIKQAISENSDINPVYYFWKIMLNSLFGKHLQRTLVRDPGKGDYGKLRTGTLFNPCYASYILADTRLRLYEILKRVSQKDIIACFTDSVLLRREYPDLNEGVALGQWSEKTSGSLLIMGSGVYTLLSKNRVKTKLRGFHTTSKVNLFEEAKKQYNKKAIKLPIKTVITLATALTRHCEGDMNKIVDDVKKIAVNFDTKRLWLGQFDKVGQYLEKQVDSLPLIYGGE